MMKIAVRDDGSLVIVASVASVAPDEEEKEKKDVEVLELVKLSSKDFCQDLQSEQIPITAVVLSCHRTELDED